MTLPTTIEEKLHTIAQLLKKDPDLILNEALDRYLQQEREKQLEAEMEAHKKETNLSYDEFWDDVDFDD
jgi:predicted transcriptional regulator